MTDPKPRGEAPDPCYYCGGACCESLLFPVLIPHSSTAEFLEIRGQPLQIAGKPHVEVESACPMLNSCGRCRIHSAGTYPKVCASYEVGGTLCRLTVQRRRRGYQRDLIEAELDSLAKWRLPHADGQASTESR